MWRSGRWASLGTMLAVTLPAGAATLAVDGKAKATIVTGASPTLAEQTAVKELAAYLGKVTGGTFAVTTEAKAPKQGVRVHVGQTAFAKEQGIDAAKLGPEEWVMRTVGNDLILTGGRPRGTLYAVYRCLAELS